MSGILGILNLDGRPVDQLLLQQLTESLAYRGPDARDTWCAGPVGFGHTLLRTAPESFREVQPLTFDGDVWITADARVDGRKGLLAKLRLQGRHVSPEASDVELILHAYYVWEEACVTHLLGDFAFAIWDSRRQRLFCARDHFGVRPFYYACQDDCLIFSNTLNCVRQHPAVSARLNDLAIADFLLFGCNREFLTTTFADIHCLPPAHCLSCSGSEAHVQRYWSLPLDGHIRYRASEDYVRHFRAVFEEAVTDRVRTDRVAVLMSGGLDSTSVAAMAHAALRAQGRPFDLRAYTYGYDRLIPDREGYYAGLVAMAIGIPICYRALDDYVPYERCADPALQTPEPSHAPQAALFFEEYRAIAARGYRVILTGHGGDPALYWPESYFADLLKRRKVGRFIREIGTFAWSNGRLPPLNLRVRLKRMLGLAPHHVPPAFPCWLDESLVRRFDLRARWQQFHTRPNSRHPVHPQAYASLTNVFWARYFEQDDASWSVFALEPRHPFFDLRVLTYLLAIPPMPWYADKTILREAMAGVLPDAVRLRSKAPLAGDPLAAKLNGSAAPRLNPFAWAPQLDQYIRRDCLPRAAGSGPSDGKLDYSALLPFALNHWLEWIHLSSIQEHDHAHESTQSA